VTNYPEWVTNAAMPCILLGETSQQKLPVFSPDGCLPDAVGAWISMKQGVRKILINELGKVKGVPETWARQAGLLALSINHMTDLHLWTAVASSISLTANASKKEFNTPDDEKGLNTIRPAPNTRKVEDPEWEWAPPDLSVGGRWHTH
jgi:hypothetical protein